MVGYTGAWSSVPSSSQELADKWIVFYRQSNGQFVVSSLSNFQSKRWDIAEWPRCKNRRRNEKLSIYCEMLHRDVTFWTRAQIKKSKLSNLHIFIHWKYNTFPTTKTVCKSLGSDAKNKVDNFDQFSCFSHFSANMTFTVVNLVAIFALSADLLMTLNKEIIEISQSNVLKVLSFLDWIRSDSLSHSEEHTRTSLQWWNKYIEFVAK